MAWRSETLTALSATNKLRKRMKIELENLTEVITKALSETFPFLFSNEASKRRFHKDIIFPADHLATKIHTSANSYLFRLVDNPHGRSVPVTSAILNDLTCVDLKTTKVIKTNSPVTANVQGIIGNMILPIEPGLYRENTSGGDTILRRQACVVELYYPLGKRQRTHQ